MPFAKYNGVLYKCKKRLNTNFRHIFSVKVVESKKTFLYICICILVKRCKNAINRRGKPKKSEKKILCFR